MDDFSLLETGLDIRRLMGYRIGEHDLDWSVFGVNTLYLISPHLLYNNPNRLNFQTDWEIGFTIGTHQPWRLLGIRMPRIGMSYRFSTKANAIRFVIGNPFKINSPRITGPSIK